MCRRNRWSWGTGLRGGDQFDTKVSLIHEHYRGVNVERVTTCSQCSIHGALETKMNGRQAPVHHVTPLDDCIRGPTGLSAPLSGYKTVKIRLITGWNPADRFVVFPSAAGCRAVTALSLSEPAGRTTAYSAPPVSALRYLIRQ